MDDAPIPREHPALGFCDDVAHGRDAILQRHGLKTAARASSTGWLESSKRPPEGEVEAVSTGQGMVALRERIDTMECQSVRSAPNYDIAMHQRNAPNPVGALFAAPQEDSWQTQRHGHDRLTEITLVAILMQ